MATLELETRTLNKRHDQTHSKLHYQTRSGCTPRHDWPRFEGVGSRCSV